MSKSAYQIGYARTNRAGPTRRALLESPRGTDRLNPVPMPVARSISGNASSVEISAWNGESMQLDQVDVAADTGKIVLRLLGGSVWSWYSRRLYEAPATAALPRASYMQDNLRRSCAPISAEPRSSTLSPWAEIIGLEMKSAMGNTFLVIPVRNAKCLSRSMDLDLAGSWARAKRCLAAR
jgi:hypothetical protein